MAIFHFVTAIGQESTSHHEQTTTFPPTLFQLYYGQIIFLALYSKSAGKFGS